MARALVLLSGGLDSMLTVKVLQAQGVEVVGICFTSNFFSCIKANTAAAQLGIELKTVDISPEIISLVKNPPSGYGKNINPCIDCHSLMIRKAGEIMRAEKFDFLATGEVLGQRPFSQNKLALGKVTKIAGVEVLRPLSAKLLPETEIEKSGLVVRGRLLDISGRNRERQIELVQKYGLKEFPMPSGGCLLTDPEFSSRLLRMLEYWPDCDNDDIELLKNGRVFWFNAAGEGNSRILAMIGRDESENNRLGLLAKKGDFMVELIDEIGPTALIRAKDRSYKFNTAAGLVSIPATLRPGELNFTEMKDPDQIGAAVKLLNGYYAPKLRGKNVNVILKAI